MSFEYPEETQGPSIGSPRSVDELDVKKSTIDEARERGAGMKASSLLDELVAGDVHKPTNKPRPTGGLTAKQAAAARYEEEKKRKNEARIAAKAFKAEQKELMKPAPKLVASKKLEKKAQTTRKIKKELTPDDVRDPESIAGMKCQLDIDRQKAAEAKALKLLEHLDNMA